MALPDPHMPPGRFHHAIFVETSKDGSGTLHHVTGDVTSTNGMSYESRESSDPPQLECFYSKQLLGYNSSDSHPGKWNALLAALPTPSQQKASNPSSHGRVEPFKEKIGDFEYVSILMGKSESRFGNVLNGLSYMQFLLLMKTALFGAVIGDCSDIRSPCSIVRIIQISSIILLHITYLVCHACISDCSCLAPFPRQGQWMLISTMPLPQTVRRISQQKKASGP